MQIKLQLENDLEERKKPTVMLFQTDNSKDTVEMTQERKIAMKTTGR